MRLSGVLGSRPATVGATQSAACITGRMRMNPPILGGKGGGGVLISSLVKTAPMTSAITQTVGDGSRRTLPTVGRATYPKKSAANGSTRANFGKLECVSYRARFVTAAM